MKPFVMECDVTCFRALGINIDKVGECLVSNTGASNPILNCVYNFNGNDTRIELDTKQILDEFNMRGLPHCWWTETASEPPRLKEILRDHHKKLYGEFLGMAIDVSKIKRGPDAPDLKISRVSTESDFTAWGKIIAEGYEFNDSDTDFYTSLFARTGADGPFYHLVGNRNGKVVSTGTVLCTEHGAYIYNIATHNTEQRKGYGSTITNALLDITKQKNQSRVALVSTVAAASIYRKLGFQEICRFNIYA